MEDEEDRGEENQEEDRRDEQDDPGLGDLHFLVRDWEYFEDDWELSVSFFGLFS